MDQSAIYKGNEAVEKLVKDFGYAEGLAAGLGSSVKVGEFKSINYVSVRMESSETKETYRLAQ